jgi:translocation and assembly module TamA
MRIGSKAVLPYLLILPVALTALEYQVRFLGLCDDDALKAVEERSDLVALQCRPPVSVNGLRYRAENDLPQIAQTLRAFGYYDAALRYEVEPIGGGFEVTVFIAPGPQYTIASYEVLKNGCAQQPGADLSGCCPLTAEQLRLPVGSPALSTAIVNAELYLLTELARCGHPLAAIDKRRIDVDMASKQVEAAVCVDEGPLSKFGPVTIYGLKGVKPRFITRKIEWKEGELYDADLVEETQKKLLKTNLFSSVLVTHAGALDPLGALPVKMRITEAKHRQISVGVFYATVDGPGVSLDWVNRNMRGMGEILSLSGEWSPRFVAGTASYKKPDFLVEGQALRFLAAVSHETIRPYHAFSYRFASYLERRFDEDRWGSIGVKVDQIHVTDSATNGSYLLIGTPLFAKYDNGDDMLNPMKGYQVVYQVTPYQSLETGNQRFIKQRLTLASYWGILPKCSFALRLQLGSIAGTARKNVPLPKLFLGGSEDELRGYRYKTVSPLNAERQPLGGRSAIYASAELRIRMTKTIGFVPFADFGTVSGKEMPNPNGKWFKSVGAGVRYFAFFGPLRFDVGFPLDRRKGIDPAFRIYATVGQSF